MRLTFLCAVLLLLSCGPKDDTGWDFDDGEACLSCHVGIEQAHPDWDPGDCTSCHGGDGTKLTIEEAHVQPPDNFAEIRGDDLPLAAHGFIRDMPPDMLDALDPAYVRFINPGDVRVLDETCGECHEEHVRNVRRSVMTTNTGHYMPTRFYAGLQGRDAIYGSYSAEDTGFTGEIPGTVAHLEALLPPDKEAIEAAFATGDRTQIEDVAYSHYLAKNCNTCHAAGYPRNNSAALYRSTGCSSCHFLYAQDGVYKGSDAAMPKSYPVYPQLHQITSDITVEQCATCHFQGGRIGLLFRGIREGGFSDTPEHAEVWNENVYGHTAGYYILDEDTTNNYDETPPDLHFSAGMVCADCHVGSDVHGDGNIYSTEKYQLDLRCEDCHGTVREAQSPDEQDVYRTQSGRALTQLYTNDEGNVALKGRISKEEHVVPQPARLLEERPEGSYMHLGMAPNEDGWAHPDSLTCDACHTSYNQQCMGCHVTMDMRLSQIDYQTGKKTAGLTTGSRSEYTLDHTVLCRTTDGRAQSCNSSQQVQLSIIGSDGEMVLGEMSDGEKVGQFRENSEHSGIIGWAPFFQHTASRTPRACSECHRTADTEEEWARVKGVYGHGTGEFMLKQAGGDPIDALQFIDDEGNAVTSFVHEGTGPLTAESRERALSVELE